MSVLSVGGETPPQPWHWKRVVESCNVWFHGASLYSVLTGIFRSCPAKTRPRPRPKWSPGLASRLSLSSPGLGSGSGACEATMCSHRIPCRIYCRQASLTRNSDAICGSTICFSSSSLKRTFICFWVFLLKASMSSFGRGACTILAVSTSLQRTTSTEKPHFLLVHPAWLHIGACTPLRNLAPSEMRQEAPIGGAHENGRRRSSV